MSLQPVINPEQIKRIDLGTSMSIASMIPPLSWEMVTYRTSCGRYEVERNGNGHWELTWFGADGARKVQILGEFPELHNARHVAAAHAVYMAVAESARAK